MQSDEIFIRFHDTRVELVDGPRNRGHRGAQSYLTFDDVAEAEAFALRLLKAIGANQAVKGY